MRRSSSGGGHGGSNELRWLLTYSDLITLLLAFFIILYAGSNADLEKFSKLAKGLSEAFGVSVLQQGEGEGGLLRETTGIFDFGQLPPSQQAFMRISESLTAFAQKEGLSDHIAVNVRSEGIAITVSDAVLFPSGGVELAPESRSTLEQIAELIRPLPNSIRIEAHTDDLPTDSAQYPTNWELSAARAASVARYLSEQVGIDPQRLAALGYGEYHPLYPNDTRERRMHNRRADIVILYPTDKPSISVNLLGTGVQRGQGAP